MRLNLVKVVRGVPGAFRNTKIKERRRRRIVDIVTLGGSLSGCLGGCLGSCPPGLWGLFYYCFITVLARGVGRGGDRRVPETRALAQIEARF